MPTNATTFTAGIDRFLERVPGREREATASFTLQILTRVTEKTPVGNPDLWKNPPPKGYVGGRARGNWQVTIGTAVDDEVERVDPSGGETIRAGNQVLAGMAPFSLIYIQNNVPYALRLEQGWSTQAPAGMVATTLAEVEVLGVSGG